MIRRWIKMFHRLAGALYTYNINSVRTSKTRYTFHPQLCYIPADLTTRS